MNHIHVIVNDVIQGKIQDTSTCEDKNMCELSLFYLISQRLVVKNDHIQYLGKRIAVFMKLKKKLQIKVLTIKRDNLILFS